MNEFPEPTPEEIAEILSYIPENPEYSEWIMIIAAVGNTIPFYEAEDLLKAWSPEQRRGEYREKLKTRLKRVGIGFIIHLAKKYGYDPKQALSKKKDLSFARWITTGTYRTNNGQSPADKTCETVSSDPICPTREYKPEIKGDFADASFIGKVMSSRGLDFPNISYDCQLFYTKTILDAGDEWGITDSSNRAVSYRHLDRSEYPNGAKSHTGKGSDGRWPIGITNVPLHNGQQTIMIAEGAPDYIALWCLKGEWDVELAEAIPVCMLSASASISEDSYKYFFGNKVIICSDNDEAGDKAFIKWRKQLWENGAASIERFHLRNWTIEGKGDINDMNEFVGGVKLGTLSRKNNTGLLSLNDFQYSLGKDII